VGIGWNVQSARADDPGDSFRCVVPWGTNSCLVCDDCTFVGAGGQFNCGTVIAAANCNETQTPHCAWTSTGYTAECLAAP
jgi:hypothetical protein